MIVYSLLFTCSLLLFVVSFKGNLFLRKGFLTFFYVVILAISALRVNIGVDYSGHYLIYNAIEMGEWMITEPLFALLCSICANFHLDFPGVVAIMSFITIAPIFIIAKRTDNPYIFLLFFLISYFISYALIRQFAAISLAIYASYLYLVENGRQRALIFFLFSIGFHTSLLIYVIAFYLSRFFNVGFLFTFIISLIIFIIGWHTDALINLLMTILSATGMDMGYVTYLDSANPHNARVELGSGLGVILRYVTYFAILYVANKTKIVRTVAGSYNILFLFLILTDVLSLKIQIFLRLRYVFLPCCFIPFFWVKPLKNKCLHISLTNGILIFLIIAYMLTYEATINSWENIPYESILFEEIK